MSDCPVCEQSLPAAATACTSCGFPTALALDALRALSEGEPEPVSAPAPKVEAPARRRSGRPASSTPEEELVQRIALDTDNHLGVLQELGGDTADVASDLRQAALAQADGRVVEALDILRRALGRVQEQSRTLFEVRVKELEARDAALRTSGVHSNTSEEAAKMRVQFASGHRVEAIEVLRAADQYLSRIEGDWKGLQSLLRQIEGLRESVVESGAPLPEVEGDIATVRSILSSPGMSVERLDDASQTAARALMLLHEALPKALQEELARHDAVLGSLPSDHVHAQRARQIHSDAVRHLRRGRLNDAARSVRELRGVLRQLAEPETKAPAAPRPAEPAAPAASAPRTAAETTQFLNRLLGRARELAARVRTLPPDSDLAFEAAGEIRLATELLRARKLDEAESTLSRLMQTLNAEPAREA